MAIGVAILGSGIFVREEHLPAILATPALALKAIYSRTLKSAQALLEKQSLPNIELYSSDSSSNTLESLLSRSDIDAVIIALPITVQPTVIKQVLQAGKHVLSEKPVGPDLASAVDLITFHKSLSNAPSWSVAENFRFYSRFRFAAKEVQRLGKVLGFRMRLTTMNKPGNKYFETPWRKTPEYQGGFLLDGGVHFIAGIRLCLGGQAKMSRIAAFATQLQDYLPPVDTVDGIVRLSNGSSGTISMSFGTTFTGAEWTVACEKGTVEVDRDRVTVVENGQKKETPMPDEGMGVGLEIKAWAAALEQGKADPMMSPEEAQADLEILELLLNSSKENGAPVDLRLQL